MIAFVKGEKKKLQLFGIGIFLVLFGLVVFLYCGGKKQVWFCDEIYTYESANGFEQEWPASRVDEWMTGKDVEAFFSADSDKFLLNEITVRLYCDHVPLYFWLFRILSVLFFPGSGTIWIGLVINLFFYLSVIVLVYALFCRLTNSPLISGVTVVLTCIVNRLMLEQATMLRMYMMLLWVECLLLLVGLRILREMRQGRMSFPAFGSLFLVSLIGFLTHYDFWVFYAATAGVFCLWILVLSIRKGKKLFWRTKEFYVVLAWCGNFAASLLTTILVFPYCKWNLNRGKGEMALKSVFVFSAEKLQHLAWGYRRLAASFFGEGFPVGAGLVIFLGCILGGMLILYRRKDWAELTGMVLTVLTAQAYQLAVCFTLPDVEEERYLWGAFSIMLFCAARGCILALGLQGERSGKKTGDGLEILDDSLGNARRKGERKHSLGRSIGAVFFCVCILAVDITAIDGGKGIEYLFDSEKDVEALREHADIPWLVYGPTIGVYSYYDWLIPGQICFLTQDNTPEDAEAVSVLAGQDSFILYLHKDYYPYAVPFLEQELGGQLDGQYLTQSTNLAVYLMRMTR